MGFTLEQTLKLFDFHAGGHWIDSAPKDDLSGAEGHSIRQREKLKCNTVVDDASTNPAESTAGWTFNIVLN